MIEPDRKRLTMHYMLIGSAIENGIADGAGQFTVRIADLGRSLDLSDTEAWAVSHAVIESGRGRAFSDERGELLLVVDTRHSTSARATFDRLMEVVDPEDHVRRAPPDAREICPFELAGAAFLFRHDESGPRLTAGLKDLATELNARPADAWDAILHLAALADVHVEKQRSGEIAIFIAIREKDVSSPAQSRPQLSPFTKEEKVLDTISRLEAEGRNATTISALAQEAGVPRGSMHDILTTLLDAGLISIARGRGRTFSMTKYKNV